MKFWWKKEIQKAQEANDKRERNAEIKTKTFKTKYEA